MRNFLAVVMGLFFWAILPLPLILSLETLNSLLQASRTGGPFVVGSIFFGASVLIGYASFRITAKLVKPKNIKLCAKITIWIIFVYYLITGISNWSETSFALLAPLCNFLGVLLGGFFAFEKTKHEVASKMVSQLNGSA